MVGFRCCEEEIKIPSKLYESMTKGGWLDEDGICHFDEYDVAHPSGFVTIPGFWNQNPTEAEIDQAINAGWIKFVDGNGDKKRAMTKKDYMAKYPYYWPPDLVLKMNGRLPPKKFYKVGKV